MPQSPSEKPRILLADDDASQRDVLHEFLESEGFAVDECANAAEVLSHALAVAPDAFVLDLHGVLTPELVRALRAERPDSALVLVSGDYRLPAVAASLGVDSYLAKPYDGDELLAAIQQGLEHAHGRSK